MLSIDDSRSWIDTLDTHGVPFWVDGGWGVDALLGEQTRSHRDLDLHSITVDHQGDGQFGPDDVYPAAGLQGRGSIGGRLVRCITPEVHRYRSWPSKSAPCSMRYSVEAPRTVRTSMCRTQATSLRIWKR